ncbi:MAG: PadR family transcriptional regulator [Candidatus Thorarchaeota archaeon]
MTGRAKYGQDREGVLPPTYLAVLSLIAAGAKYGYEINQILEQRGYRNWVDIKMSSIYKALNELEERRLISGRKSDKDLRPAKKTYKVTRTGRRVLKDQVIRCLSNPPRVNTMFDLGISAIWTLTRSEALEALEEYKDRLLLAAAFLQSHVDAIVDFDVLKETEPERQVGDMRISEVEDKSNLPIVKALFERPLVAVEAQHQYLERLVSRIESGEEEFPFRTEKREKGEK